MSIIFYLILFVDLVTKLALSFFWDQRPNAFCGLFYHLFGFLQFQYYSVYHSLGLAILALGVFSELPSGWLKSLT